MAKIIEEAESNKAEQKANADISLAQKNSDLKNCSAQSVIEIS